MLTSDLWLCESASDIGLSSKYTLPPTCLVVLKLNMVLALVYSRFDHRLQAPSSNSSPEIHKVINYIFKLLTYSTGKKYFRLL